MMEQLADQKRLRYFSLMEVVIIVLLAIVPLFATFPYRVNIFLSWEGAYRMSMGQVPYRDFGMPMGYMFWVVPAIFFKIFGAQLITLVKAQVFINIISGLAFRSILRSLVPDAGIRLVSVLLYCLSFSFFNFWPWYNHTVIVYEMAGLAFLLQYLTSARPRWAQLFLSGVFLFFSFFTKQDGGALGFFICLALLGWDAWLKKRWQPTALFVGSFFLTGVALIAPFLQYDFAYWFNYGQAPHTARISPAGIVDEFFGASQWIKFYLFLIILTVPATFRTWKELKEDHRSSLFLLLTLGVLAEAAVLQVTSYTPPDNNIFFHSFAIAFLLSQLCRTWGIRLTETKWLLMAAAGICLWWTPVFWRYVQRITQQQTEAGIHQSAGGENVVNRNNYMLIRDTTEVPASQWSFTGLRAFEKVYLPAPTAAGIRRLMLWKKTNATEAVKVLNMTELTPLASELPYATEKGPGIPLWYHLGVSMFNREAALYERRIAARYYDLILFEYIPTLNNFFPFRVRDSIRMHYQKIDSFYAPRRGAETKGIIEVYTK